MKFIFFASIFLLMCIVLIPMSAQSVQPNGGGMEKDWIQRDTVLIKWFFPRVDTVNIKLWNMNTSSYTTIEQNYYDSTMQYSWVIPDDQSVGSYFRLRIENSDSTDDYIMSESYFPIYEYIGGGIKTNIEDYHYKKDIISIFPNPGNKLLNISWDYSYPPLQFYVVDNSGNIVRSRHFIKDSKNIIFNAENIPNGSYLFVLIFGNGKISSHKMLIER